MAEIEIENGMLGVKRDTLMCLVIFRENSFKNK
jgi:hypothetical protein